MALLSVHYHELALKGANRPRFQRALVRNVKRALGELGRCRVTQAASRLLVEVDADAERALDRATRVCGVAYAMPIERMARDLDAVGRRIADVFRADPPATFRISAKRADKDFPLTSVDIDRKVGAIVHETLGIPVRLKGADADIHLAVLRDEILVGFEKRPGPGGLPVSTAGRVVVLMSGGLDSPVAAWRMMNRGCRCDLVHFHSHPLVDRTTQEKARDLAALLTRWQYETRLHLVPLAEIQTQVRLGAPEALRVVLYRRFMVRIAERIARERGARALVTGESLGQVASQTLENLATVDAVASLPILRPLIGTDKQEIIRTAEALGSYAISIRPDQDCCRLFVPARPATRSTPEEAEAAEAELDVDALVADAVARAEALDLS